MSSRPPGKITCVGFSEELLPILDSALDAGHVKWVVKLKDGYCAFDYLGFRYVIASDADNNETITKTCKVDVDDDGETVVIQNLEAERADAAYSGDWGAF